ncbi:ABC transporter ATP-binding protein [Pseudoalteromonas sp. MMG013]|uniref:ABC-2 type transport system ATP-binding protein n=1 Tax=Pseudoalteromonas aurantia 208 TaxID=1314867 RepID=A0ABR9EJ76_9GAMM|nr:MULTISPECIES: ABC transporter ATP-binding protein [Pseudoalteromonas]MBE0370474.1 ABC-2 type transport system ATP-binding protein [Pseudoalteromonas aurantia 208]MBQ4845088.1 ABC transporter ATP-binding protein [Pseudoalteromonas sp. MMG005]MBQ4849256.1 ABC transporter ATP-binding protein [Pseudoalteromonas sp. MMG012]MBQ4863873.1 ABC transporter ATP-binding protein [Pseudoalteromonas sp. MMG013]
MTSVIEVKSLRKVYSRTNKVAVDDVSFSVQEGECFGLLGPNGAGKTTTLEILQGLRKPTSGEITLFGYTWQKHETQLRGLMGGVMQHNNLYDKLKVKECVELFASFYQNYTPILELLERFNLLEKKDAWLSELSGGQKQRVFLAMAVVGQPRLVFLDEPTTGLDPTSRQDFWHIIKDLKESGTCILMTTHYMDEAEFLCDNLAIINSGKIIEAGRPNDIINRTFEAPIIKEPRKATLNDVFLKLTGSSISRESYA